MESHYTLGLQARYKILCPNVDFMATVWEQWLIFDNLKALPHFLLFFNLNT
jgi:hypothetical protein